MTDREYLELAAKAVGNPVGTSRAGGGLLMANDLYWNPITYDGDALRLAVCLRLKIELKTNHVYVIDDESGLVIAEDYGTDPYSATRLAIVRAAAEIGKGTKPFPTAKEIREE